MSEEEDEDDEEILGSDDDEQEDPKDYCKGNHFCFFYLPRVI